MQHLPRFVASKIAGWKTPGDAMDFIVTDRNTIERGIPLPLPHIIISVTDPGSAEAAIPANEQCRGILRLAFHDAEPSRFFFAPLDRRLMTSQQAQQVWNFFRQHATNIEAVLVHCEKGLSRSPAIAAALCRSTGDDESRFFREFEPNRHVFTMLTAMESSDAE